MFQAGIVVTMTLVQQSISWINKDHQFGNTLFKFGPISIDSIAIPRTLEEDLACINQIKNITCSTGDLFGIVVATARGLESEFNTI
jgi:hypothetical protein